MPRSLSPAARTIVLFSFYIWLTGLFMLAFPQVILNSSHTGLEALPWVRVLGVVLLILGFYYFMSGWGEQTGFFRATVWGRWFSFPLFLVLGWAGLLPMLMAFGTLLDVAGATWTYLALRKQGNWM